MTAVDNILEVTWQSRQVVIDAQQLSLRCLAVTFQNRGTADVILNKTWTIPAGGTYSLSPSADTSILVLDLDITFAAVGTRVLEIAELSVDEIQFANYATRRNGIC